MFGARHCADDVRAYFKHDLEPNGGNDATSSCSSITVVLFVLPPQKATTSRQLSPD